LERAGVKTLACVILLLGICINYGHCQGTVNFNNGGIAFATTADRNVYLGAVGTQNGGTLVVGTKFKVQLYVGTDVNNLLSVNAPFSSFRASAGAGTWSGGSRTLTDTSGVSYYGGGVMLAVRAWDINSGPSWDLATIRGTSDPFMYVIPTVSPPPGAWYMEGLRAFAITIPEPGTFALTATVLLGFVMARWRK
jgi:hypothetical protein